MTIKQLMFHLSMLEGMLLADSEHLADACGAAREIVRGLVQAGVVNEMDRVNN